MRRMKFVLLTALVLAAAVLGFKGLTSAQVFRVGPHVDLGSHQMIDSSVYTAGQNLKIAAEINGDVFCAGQDVHITGTVHGDVLCAGQTISVTGKVDGNVRLVGQTVTVDGSVAGNASVAAQTFTLGDHASVGKDLSLATNDSEVLGTVGRDIALASQAVTLASHVGRDVTGTVKDLALDDGAVIAGNLNYTSNNIVSQVPTAKVLGTTVRHTPAAHQHRSWFATRVFGSLFIFSFLLILTLVATLLFPGMMRAGAAFPSQKPFKTFGIGLLVMFVVPILLLALLISLIGVPVAIVGGLLWLVALALSGPVFALFVGRVLLGKKTNLFLAALLGVFVLGVLSLIPFIGFLTWLATTIFGLGAIGLLIAKNYHRPVYNAE